MTTDNFIRETENGQKRGQSFVIAVSLCFLLSVGFAVCWGGRAGRLFEIELASRINPNDAPAASLIRLPGIGVVRAGAIVAYRESFVEQKNDGMAFQSCEDLQVVKGIGPKTVQNICGWLKFE